MLRLNLCSRRWLRVSLILVTNLIPFGLRRWKILLGEGLINFKIVFLKTLDLAEFQREGSSLLHSKKADGRNVFLKKLCLKLKEGTLATRLVWYASLQVGISSIK